VCVRVWNIYLTLYMLYMVPVNRTHVSVFIFIFVPRIYYSLYVKLVLHLNYDIFCILWLSPTKDVWNVNELCSILSQNIQT